MTDKPTFHAYSVRKYKKQDGAEDAMWSRIGAAFAHKDAKGYDVVLDAVPLDGRISLREPKEPSAG